MDDTGTGIARRTFLRRLGALGVGLLGAGRVPAAEARPRTAVLGRFFVAGFQYHRGPGLLGRMRAGDPLTLVSEPDNRYDARAVRIEWRGEKLGYVPKRRNHPFGPLLRSGAPVRARIADIDPGEVPWRTLSVDVTLEFRDP